MRLRQPAWVLPWGVGLGVVALVWAGASLTRAPAGIFPSPRPSVPDASGSTVWGGPHLEVAVPDFALLDQQGRVVRRSDLDGRPWVAAFLFTRCGGQCPAMTQRLVELADRVPATVRLVCFTVDPAYDTPAVLDRYARAIGARSDQWRFLTGSRDVIYRLAREVFHVGVDEAGGTASEPFLHSTRLMLVDQGGRVRGSVEGLSPDAVDRVVSRLSALVERPDVLARDEAGR